MYEKKVREALESPALRALYANTFYSLTDRIDEMGYLEESYVPGRYPGCFARSAGAFVFLAAEAGQVDLAVRALRFVLDSMRRGGLSRAPHVLGKVRYGADGTLLQELDTVCQIDGTAHILSAYAELILRYGRQELFEAYWPMMASILSAHADQPYFFSHPICGFPVANLHLFLNTAFEHSREGRYWCCFDLLTQSFMGASLQKMAAVARMNSQHASAAFWEAQLERLKAGIRAYLTGDDDGRTVYLEMRLPDGNAGKPYGGMGWVNYSPIAADWEALPPDVMRNTVRALRERLWKPDPDGDGLYFLSKETEPDGGFCPETIGKGVGWDIEAARREGDYRHICDSLQFLIHRHREALYGECMFYADGAWKTRDCGNAEQSIWWCWAISRLRASLGMERVPRRADVTQRMQVMSTYTVRGSA